MTPVAETVKVERFGILEFVWLGSLLLLATTSRLAPLGRTLSKNPRLAGCVPADWIGEPFGVKLPSALMVKDAIVLLCPLTANKSVPAAFVTTCWSSSCWIPKDPPQPVPPVL